MMNDEFDDDDFFYEQEQAYRDADRDEELMNQLIDFDCTCGAYRIMNGRIVHIADCLCGYG